MRANTDGIITIDIDATADSRGSLSGSIRIRTKSHALTCAFFVCTARSSLGLCTNGNVISATGSSTCTQCQGIVSNCGSSFITNGYPFIRTDTSLTTQCISVNIGYHGLIANSRAIAGIGQCSHTNGNATFGWLLFRIISNSRLVVCIRI